MELKLEKFINSLEITTNIHRQHEAPIIVRVTRDDDGSAHVVCCSYFKPRYILLPIQAIWIDFNPESETFRHAYLRTTKGKTPDEDVWKVLYFYADAFPVQEYDPADIELISITLPPPATTAVQGIGYLSTANAESRAIIEGHDALTDNRDPRDHTHKEKPATLVRDGNGVAVPIASQPNPRLFQALVADADHDGKVTYSWRRVKEQDLGV